MSSRAEGVLQQPAHGSSIPLPTPRQPFSLGQLLQNPRLGFLLAMPSFGKAMAKFSVSAQSKGCPEELDTKPRVWADLKGSKPSLEAARHGVSQARRPQLCLDGYSAWPGTALCPPSVHGRGLGCGVMPQGPFFLPCPHLTSQVRTQV